MDDKYFNTQTCCNLPFLVIYGVAIILQSYLEGDNNVFFYLYLIYQGMTLSDVSSNDGDMEIDQLDFSDCRNCFILFHKFSTEVYSQNINFNFKIYELISNILYTISVNYSIERLQPGKHDLCVAYVIFFIKCLYSVYKKNT